LKIVATLVQLNRYQIMIEVFPAINGDCFLIHTEDGLILIDCGYASTYSDHLKPALELLGKEGKVILRFVVTHIDEDHIQGAIKFLSENGHANTPKIIKINEIWHNSYRHLNAERITALISFDGENLLKSTFKSVEQNGDKQISAKQGTSLSSLILQNGYNWNNDFSGNAISVDRVNTGKISDQITFTLLSPNDLALIKLEKYWRKELYKIGFREKITTQEIFDDAFEFLLMNNKVVPNEQDDKQVSSSGFDVTELLKNKCDPDDSVKNASSLAFVLKVGKKALLFLGDAIPKIVNENLEKVFQSVEKPVIFDFIKLSHHGSFGNNCPKLFELTDSPKYCISTKGETNPHPSKETLAWIIGRKSGQHRELCFNYKNSGYDLLNNAELMAEYNFEISLNDDLSNRIITIE
jgi:beta-lactamase superfamily II metal-dependent hydrolase